MKSYVPKRLIAIKEKIIVDHPIEISNPILHQEDNDAVFELIEKLIKMDEKELEREALLIPSEIITQLACIVPKLTIQLDGLKKLFKVIAYNSNERAYMNMLYHWQNFYKNELMYYCLKIENNELFLKVLDEKYCGQKQFKLLLNNNAKTIPVNIGRMLYRDNNLFTMNLDDRIEAYGLNSGSRLGLEIRRILFTFCDKNEYLKYSQSDILKEITKFSKFEYLNFVKNFLEKLTLYELEEFEEIIRFILGNSSVISKEELMEKLNDFLKNKLNHWTNSYNLQKAFSKEDIRYNFWKKYDLKNIIFFKRSGSIAIEFEDYFVVEFLGKGRGPFYVYEKDAFMNYVFYLIKNESHKKITNTLYHKFENQTIPTVTRMKHFTAKDGYPIWIDGAHKFLISNNIANKIDYSK